MLVIHDKITLQKITQALSSVDTVFRSIAEDAALMLAGIPSQPMNRLSASSCVRSFPQKEVMGGGSGRAGISALLPRQLCFWRMHSEKSSSSCDSCDTMQRYEHTWISMYLCQTVTHTVEVTS